MGLLGKLLIVVAAATTVFLAIKLNRCFDVPPVPKMDEPYWGPGKPANDSTEIRPFKIDVSEKVLVDLKARLKSRRDLVAALEGAKQHYGMNSKLLEEILDFWTTKYDWRQREKFLNKFPQYKTKIQGLDIHYLHVKPTAKDVKVVTILLMHGWPRSVREFYEMIPILTTKQPGRDFVFEVIAPSLPGYGFSDGAAKQGLGPAQVAVVFKNLMERIGIKKYYTQGGDWGAWIAAAMASLYEDRILGGHSNMCQNFRKTGFMKVFLGSFYPPWVVEEKYEKRMYPLSSKFAFALLEFGSMHIQSTKPDTVGFALNDSPVGLAAYILEKFTTATNPNMKDLDDGGLKSKFKYEDLLDNVMIYWVTNSITTSMRMYSEAFTKAHNELQIDELLVKVPFACANFLHELFYHSESILRGKFVNLVQNNHFDVGGHFASFELPEIVAEDIFSAVEQMRKL